MTKGNRFMPEIQLNDKSFLDSGLTGVNFTGLTESNCKLNVLTLNLSYRRMKWKIKEDFYELSVLKFHVTKAKKCFLLFSFSFQFRPHLQL